MDDVTKRVVEEMHGKVELISAKSLSTDFGVYEVIVCVGKNRLNDFLKLLEGFKNGKA